MMRIKFYLTYSFALMLFLAFAGNAIAQGPAIVKGKVTDEANLSLPGVTVRVKNGAATSTDVNGNFTIQVPDKNSTLVFSAMGSLTREELLNGRTTLTIVLANDTKSLDEVVVVAYGTQKKISVTGAITVVKGEELARSPALNLSQALVGRTSGVLSQQTSGEPGKDNVALRVRGASTLGNKDPLVLVDGVERPFGTINPEEVENLTVLKDASTTAVYGIRGANGVILITTKRGTRGAPKVSVASSVAMQSPTRLPDFIDSYNYANLYNEALKNDNPSLTDAQLLFKPADLELYKNGNDPIFHPDIDYFDFMMKQAAPQSKSTLTINGGGDNAKYFMSLGYLNQDGLWKEFNDKFDYSNNTTYNRFNFRSNVDFNITPSTILGLSLGGYSGKKHTAGNPFSTMMDSSPLTTPVLVDDKIILNDAITSRNSAVTSISGGYDDIFSNQFNLTADLNQKLSVITPGLSFRSKIGFDNDYATTISKNVTRIKYKPIKTTINGVETIVYQPLNDQSVAGETAASFSERSKRLYMEAAMQYNRSFKKHNTSGLLLYNQNKIWWPGTEYPEVPIGYLGLVGRLTYDYDNRYLLEFSLGRNGSENFPPGKRFGIFPAVSAGWNVTREPYVQKILGENSALTHLKFRASYGETGNDKTGGRRFMYFPSAYNAVSGVARLGEDYTIVNGFAEGQLGNPDITWEKAIKQNYGAEIGLFSDKLNLKFDYFYDQRNNILYQQQTIAHVAAAIQDIYNIAQVSNQGYEIEAGWNGTAGKVNYFINGNYTFAKDKVLANGVPVDPLNPHTSQVGISQNQPLGLIALGFFNTQAEADAWPIQFSSKGTPGDVRYMDYNGDGKVNEKDFSPIGSPNYPQINFGSSMGLSFKGFDVSVLFQGAARVTRMLSGYMQKPHFQFASTLTSVLEERWTPENTANASRPKLTATYANSTNYQSSTLWLRDASYLRLKNVELGYRFSGGILKRAGMSSARLYVSGQNLITWDKLKIVDPEQSASNSYSYPQLQTFNTGLSIQF
jgi:TonB-linked SusC/RagA family outer membrane protein